MGDRLEVGPNHHRIIPAGGNLDPIPEGSYHNRGSAFGLWLNGGVLLGPAAHEGVARARGLGAEGAWVILPDLEIEWQKSRLARIPMIDWCRGSLELARRNPRLTYTGGNAWTWIDGPEPSGAGTETNLGDGGAILWALYTAVLGSQADFQGITLEPHVPAALADVRTELRLLGRQVTVRPGIRKGGGRRGRHRRARIRLLFPLRRDKSGRGRYLLNPRS